MVDCDFCGKNIVSGTGKMFVKKDGSILRFCSSKCEKSVNNRRFKARITPWTKEFAKIKQQKLSK